MCGGGGATRPLPMGAWTVKIQQSGYAPKLWPEVKNGSSAKDGVPAHKRDNPGGELDPAVDVSRRCMKFPSVLTCIGKMTKEGCDRGNEVGAVHSGRGGEGPVSVRKHENVKTVKYSGSAKHLNHNY